MKQVVRQLMDGMDRFARGKPHLIIDRDTRDSEGFRQTRAHGGFNIAISVAY